MISARILATPIAWVLISTPLIAAQDLSKYREFHLGMSVVAVARQARIAPEARVLHQRPELIQELTWLPPRTLGSSAQGDSVRKVLFSFYNDQLYRIVVSYDWDRTEGLTVDDMVEALSKVYGPPMPPAKEIGVPLPRSNAHSDRIVAHWEDAQYSLDLVRPSNASTFGLVMFSKPLDALAQAAVVEAIRLDDQDASKRAIERKQKQEDEDHTRQEMVRRANKAIFRL